MIKRVDHINIVVSDLERAKTFFTGLGFEVIDSAFLTGDMFSKVVGLDNIAAEYVALALPDSETKLELICYDQPKGERDPLLGRANQLGLRHVAFAVDSIQATVARLKARQVRFQSDIQTWRRSGKQIVYFFGPEGILLELAQYPDS